MDWFVAEDAWLARDLFQHGLALLYVVAFVAAARQYPGLLGERGLLPVGAYVARTPFRRSPSLFQLHHSDRFFLGVAWSGAALAGAVVVGVADVVPLPVAMLLWAVLWLLYLSVVNVGQRWYSFGWESLLLETGFLAVFLGNDDVAPPLLVLLLLRWLLFRLELGAGLIKIRGDRCWRDLTCLHHHHETQPMPGPLSWWFHHLPGPLHKVEVLSNHVTQLVVPFLLFLPQPVAGGAAAVMLVTQLWLVLSGNFAWLNWLAIVVAASVLPGAWLAPLVPCVGPLPVGATPPWFTGVVLAATALVVVLSRWPVANLLSRRQVMNSSFNRWHLVNTYGAFGTVTRVRDEIVIEGQAADGTWHEYEVPGKPGDPARRPPQVAPYHHRLGWLLWFAALSPGYADPWFRVLVRRLLEADPAVLRLLRHDPFAGERPQAVRAVVHRYRFTTRAERRDSGDWWVRARTRVFVAPTALRDGALRPA